MTTSPATNPPAPITGTDVVLLDADAGSTKEAVIGRLAGMLADSGRADQ